MPADTRAIQRFYGRWAGIYDWIATAPGIGRWRTAVVDALDIQPGDVVVEMGCGTGANLPLLCERVTDTGTVIGVDLTPGALDRARHRVDCPRWHNVDLVVGDARDPPIAGEVDAVLGTFVAGMFDDPAAVVDRWCDLLGPGGRLALLDAGPSDRAVAAPLNLGFRALTRLSAPSSRTAVRSPATEVSERIDQAHERLDERTTKCRHRRRGLGFLRQSSGTVR